MSQFPIYFRKQNGICNKTYISSHMNIANVKNHISHLINLETQDFDLLIRCNNISDNLSRNKALLVPNTILDIVEKASLQQGKQNFQSQIHIKFIKDGKQKNTRINLSTTVYQLKVTASNFFDIPCTTSQFIFQNGFSFSEDKRLCRVLQKIQEMNQKKYSSLSVQIKPKIQSLFQTINTPTKMKLVESVASEENQNSDFNDSQKEYNSRILRKKQSCCKSMKYIKDQFTDIPGKRSAIITENCSRTPDNIRKLNGLKKLTVNDIRQTISYGSMQEQQIPDSIQVELTNLENTHYYRLSCSPLIKFIQIKQTLAKLEGKKTQQIFISQNLKDSISLIDAHELSDQFELKHEGKSLFLTLNYS